MEIEKSHSDSELAGDWFKPQSPAAPDEPIMNLWFSKMPQENPKLRNVSLTQGNIVFPAINRADAPLAEALINYCSIHNKRELDYKTGRRVVSCINYDCRDLALVTLFLWLSG